MSLSCWWSSSWSWLICPLRMVENMPCRWWWISAQECWLEFHFRGVTHSLERSGLGESNGVEVVCHHLGSLFCDMASPCSPAAPKVILESKHKHTLFPKLIVQLGLPIFLLLMGLCITPRSVVLQDCFTQSVCLWVTLDYHHNSKICIYILLVWLNSWGMFPDSPFFVCLIMF